MRKVLPCLLILTLLLSGCGSKEYVVRDFMLNTEVSITVYNGNKKAAESALDLCRTYEKIFSRTDPESELYRLNSREITTVSDELAEVIALGLEYAAISDGALDITMGGVSNLWDFTSSTPSVPADEHVKRQLSHTGWQGISVKGNSITFSDSETTVDLGAIAKGYIADRLAEHLENEGVTSAMINLGGNIYCLGNKPDGSDFQIGIQYPYEARNEVIGGVVVQNGSVVTSGIYERCFTENGKLYHHLLDPDTGYPVDNELLAVSIVSDRSVDGDALSTACFVLGLEDGTALVEKIEGVEALFITKDYTVHYTNGLEGVFFEA